jgi:hypothetical protein
MFVMPLRLVAACALATAVAGCDFFRELEDADSADTGGSGSDTAGSESGTGALVDGAPCQVALDDRCEDQDLLASCSPEDGILRVVDCAQTCGVYTNFACIGTQTGQHACWCVEPGKQKVLNCGEIEVCLSECPDFGPCTDACFAKTTESTTRLYGALVHCAQAHCDELCRTDPASCAGCTAQARVEGSGECTLARALCDADQNDEPWP